MEEEQEIEIENRRSQRVPAFMHLQVSSVFKQNNVHVSNLNAPIEVIVTLTAFYGLRRSEVLGLKWSAIDFENKTIRYEGWAIAQLVMCLL